MALTRRGFLGLVSTGIVGACVVSKIPTGWIPQPIRTRAACEFMRKHYNEYTKGIPLFDADRWPKALLVGRELYEAFEGELIANERFIGYDLSAPPYAGGLMFKGATVWVDGRGWTVRILNRAEWRALNA